MTDRRINGKFALPSHFVCSPDRTARPGRWLGALVKITSRLLIWLLCAGALVLACGPHAHRSESAAASTTDDPPAPQPATPAAVGQLLATSANVSVAGHVSLSLHVTNLADHSLELDFPNGQTHDFVVLDSTGAELWRWSSGRMFTQALQNKLLSSNETVSYEEQWNPHGLHGDFTLVAILHSSNYPKEERVGFSVP